MQVIHLTHPYEEKQIPKEKIVLALGFFDGIHKGHQKVITTAAKIAKSSNYKLAVMSFDHHPSVVFGDAKVDDIQYISPMERKIELLENLGVDFFYVVQFDKDFASLKPQDFVDQYIVALHTQVVVAGFDYTYGPHEIANMELLQTYSQNRFEIVTIPEQRNRHGKISSTAIRQALESGQMQSANKLLGYTYQFSGEVINGHGRGGRLLGYPTANLNVGKEVLLPARGVYICQAKVDGIWYPAMSSIGFNPTFVPEEQVTVEVNILGFDKDIYGQVIETRWFYFLRPELKFDSVDALIQQLDEDKMATEEYFSKKG